MGGYLRKRIRQAHLRGGYTKPSNLREYDPDYFALFRVKDPVIVMLMGLIQNDMEKDPLGTRSVLKNAQKQYWFLTCNSEAVAVLYKHRVVAMVERLSATGLFKGEAMDEALTSLDALCLQVSSTKDAPDALRVCARNLVSGEWDVGFSKPIDR